MASLISIFFSLVLASSFYFSSCESRKGLRDKDAEKETHEEFGSSSPSNRVDPGRVLQLLWRPRVFFYQGFLSVDECEHLISLGKETSRINNLLVDGHTRTQLQGSESQSNIPDYIVGRIEERIAAWTFLPRENSEPMQVTRYGSERSEQKLDYFSSYSGDSRLESTESLMAVMVLYLSNATRQGGELVFPYSQAKTKIWSDCRKTLSVLRPARGNAVLIFTRHLNASFDPTSFHSRCPVMEGEIWCATKLFHVKPTKRVSRLVEQEQEDGECSDEDDNCPRWAALGECQRNPVYMIGSPDYYGTCRKSCKAC